MTGQARDEDLTDARFIADVVEAARRWRASSGRRVRQKPIREAIWFYWQEPRLSAPLVRSKYPKRAMWTEAARAAYAADEALEIDHVEPMENLIRRLLDGPTTLDRVLEELRPSLMCVVTPGEHARLTAAGSPATIASVDPWQRYRDAGVDLARVKPLEST